MEVNPNKKRRRHIEKKMPERFKNTPVYIDRPAPEEEAVLASVEDIQLPEKTIANLNHIDPFDDMVNKIKL